MKRLALLLALVSCDRDKQVTSQVEQLEGDRVASNKLAAPPGAAWRSAWIRRSLHRGNSKLDLVQKAWGVVVDLVVMYPAGESWTRMLGTTERDDPDFIAHATAKYELRATASGGVEMRTNDGAWAPIELPRAPLPAISVDELAKLLPAGDWSKTERYHQGVHRDHDGTRYTPWLAQWDRPKADDMIEYTLVFFDCDERPHAQCTDMPGKFAGVPSRVEAEALCVRPGRIAFCVESKVHPAADIEAMAKQFDLAKLARLGA